MTTDGYVGAGGSIVHANSDAARSNEIYVDSLNVVERRHYFDSLIGTANPTGSVLGGNDLVPVRGGSRGCNEVARLRVLSPLPVSHPGVMKLILSASDVTTGVTRKDGADLRWVRCMELFGEKVSFFDETEQRFSSVTTAGERSLGRQAAEKDAVCYLRNIYPTVSAIEEHALTSALKRDPRWLHVWLKFQQHFARFLNGELK